MDLGWLRLGRRKQPEGSSLVISEELQKPLNPFLMTHFPLGPQADAQLRFFVDLGEFTLGRVEGIVQELFDDLTAQLQLEPESFLAAPGKSFERLLAHGSTSDFFRFIKAKESHYELVLSTPSLKPTVDPVGFSKTLGDSFPATVEFLYESERQGERELHRHRGVPLRLDAKGFLLRKTTGVRRYNFEQVRWMTTYGKRTSQLPSWTAVFELDRVPSRNILRARGTLAVSLLETEPYGRHFNGFEDDPLESEEESR